MQGEVFVGVDGGTGDMEAVVVDSGGSVLGRGTGGPSNDPEVVGRMHPQVGEHIVGAICRALDDARLAPAQVEAVSLNLSGDPSALTPRRAREWLAPVELSPDAVLSIDQDGLSAWAAGGFPDPAMWVLLGTNCGSEGMLDGRKVGHPLARLDLDAHLGRAVGGSVVGTWALGLAIRAALGGRPTRLLEAYQRELGADDWHGLVDWSVEHDTSDERAQLFKVLAEVAGSEDGDQPAADLLRLSAREIADATCVLASAMQVGAQDQRPVALLLAGKAWQAGGMLLDEFRASLHARLPGTRIQVNEVSQAEGAALLAMRHAGLEPGPEIFTRLGASVD
jgi:N-acetylglucosamine kinase-like BadF-type ATPase